MTSETLDEARRRLQAQMGAGARYDSPAAPSDALRAMRIARANCQRQLTLVADDALETQSVARIVARIGCTARLIAEAFEAVSDHQGIEGDHADRSSNPEADITLASTLPGRALRSLYQHALQHLDVACRDLDADGWSAVLTLTLAETPAGAVWHMAQLLDAGARALDLYVRTGNAPNF